ncbi:beta-ketoacyl-ACP synthase II [Halobacteriovorax sp. HFRX-2_2]|uniref:beta-ketoacyl-ACP synthase II n=1 Tax=unclassified Halobacteriovorax TaxID=2639665 RepID=UPI0037198EB4
MSNRSNKRVVITGLGTICGLGQNTQEVWNGLIEGKSGISEAESFPIPDLAIKIAGEVKNFELDESIMEAREAKKYDRFIHFALHATEEALKDSGANLEDFDKYKVGAILGVGIGGFPITEETAKTFVERGPRRISPFFIPAIIPNMASGVLSIRHGFMGVNYTVSSACASSCHAISNAVEEIRSGRHDLMITGGTEAVICNLGMGGFINMKAFSKRTDEPTKASRPFDIDRDGFVMGEGAGVLILEDYDSAVKRGAKIYAEIVGHGATSDAHHITAPHPEGDGAYGCMKKAIEDAGIRPEDIDYVNAHGTSTPLGDVAETGAIKRVLGEEHAKKINVSSTKSMTGHLLGAAGGVETVFTALALHHGIIPPTINLDNQDPKCDLNYTANTAVKKDIKYALNNSFGFGSTNSSLVLKKIED